MCVILHFQLAWSVRRQEMKNERGGRDTDVQEGMGRMAGKWIERRDDE